MTQQIYTTPTPFSGTNISIPNSGKGYTSNMVIKGQTYQNLVTENNGIDVFKASNLKPNTKYTIIVTKEGGQSQLNLVGNHSSHSCLINKNAPNGTYKVVRQTDNQDTEFYLANVTPNSESVKLSSFIVLEGDWTNKEVPSQIDGIESVGEKENNKISILSHNKNLFDESQLDFDGEYYTCNYDRAYFNSCKYKVKVNPNTVYRISYNIPKDKSCWISVSYFVDGVAVYGFHNSGVDCDQTFTTPSGNEIYLVLAPNTPSDTMLVKNVMLTLGAKKYEYEAYKEDKKEILLPIEGGLKSLPNGVCDTIEQREDGVYLVQKVGKVIFDGSRNEWGLQSINSNNIANFIISTPSHADNEVYCDKFIYDNNFISTATREGIFVNESSFYIRINKAKADTVEKFKKWLQANPTTVYYKFDTPIETKLDINNINLQTFKDLTYVISDDSVEPVLEFKAPILGYKTINPIQLKTTQDGTEVNVYPYSTPELITFGDNETLADKMNNIENTHTHNNATVTTDGFMSKESYSKLESLTNYTHPSTHAATMITEDSTHRFITDTERNNWNAKASTNIATPSTNGLMSNTDKQKIDRISNNFDIVYDANTETIRFRFR